MEFNSRIKYSQQKCNLALSLIDDGSSIESVSKKIGIPATTIRNYKHGYIKIYGSFESFDSKKKKNALYLASQGLKIKDIAKNIKVSYDSVRLFLKKSLDKDKYEKVKITPFKVSKSAKRLTKELAYIFGVLIGDGYFADCQFRLDTIDNEFRDFFSEIVEKWSGKITKNREFVNGSSFFYGCIFYSKEACEFFKGLSRNKISFVHKILNSKDEIIKTHFVKGFCDSEGTIAKDHRLIRIYSIDKDLLENIKQLLVSLGFDDNKMHILISIRNVYELGIKSHKNIELFYQRIGFTIIRKQKRLEYFINKKRAATGI